LTRRFKVRLEGLYYHFGNRVDTSTLNTDSDPGDFAELESILVGRLGISYALGAAPDERAAHVAFVPANWAGFYAGGNFGYGVVDFDSIFDSSEIFTPINTEDSVIGDFFDLDGVLGGVHAGVNRQRGRMVFGAEGDWTYLNKSDLEFDPDGGTPGDDSASIDLDWLATLRGRLGITSARTLLYATAGVAWVNGDYTARNGNVGNQNQGSTNVDSTGFVYGGGIEHALRDNLLARFEVLQYEFNDRRDTSTLTTDSDPGDFAGVDDVTVVRVGLTRKFGVRVN
jgi:outer membrane immunogenic protein